MDNRIDTTIVLGSKRYKSSIDTDLGIKIPLEGNQKEIDEFDRSNVVNLAQIFDEERQESSTFRLTAKLDLLFYNAYSGITGNPDYKPFTYNLYYVNSVNSFGTTSWSGYPQYVEFDLMRTDNSTSGYTSYSGTTPPHVEFINKSASTYNWTQYVSYPYQNDYTKKLQYYRTSNNSVNWVSGDGIPFYIVNPLLSNGQPLISFVCPVKHNLTVGEYVEIEINGGWGGYDGNKVFQVYSLGNNGYNSENYVFNLYNIGYSGATFLNSTEGTFKRIVDISNSAETKSKYYVRKHMIITNVDEAILTKAAFDQNGFNVKRQYEYSSLTPDNVARITQKENNQSYLLTFSKDINIKPYRDNLNRPLSELYITLINKGYFGWFNKPINSNIPNSPALKEGYGFNIEYTSSPYWSSANASINSSNISTLSYTRPGSPSPFYYNQDLKSGDTINGDFCEYNQFEQREIVLSNFHHKFGFNSSLFIEDYLLTNDIFLLNSRIPNPEGYYYQPHHPITLKVFSDYIEEGDINNIEGVPDYAYYSQYKGLLIWRDLYTYGFKDESGNGTDFPFINGVHYPSTNIVFRVFPEGNVAEDISAIAQPITDDCE
jgi:hypothetical protein